jgi:hypothetical protein
VRLLAFAVVCAAVLIGCGDDGGNAATPHGIGVELRTPGVVATVTGTVPASLTNPARAQGSEAELCGDLDSFALALTAFRGLSGSSTIEELQQASENVHAAWQDVLRSAVDVEQARVDAVGQAVAQLRSHAGEVSPAQGIGEAYATLLPDVSAVEQAYAGLDSEAACP